MEQGGNINDVNKFAEFFFKIVVIVLLSANLILNYRIKVEPVANNQLILANQQQAYIDSLLNKLDYKPIGPKQINNYFNTKENEKIKIINDFTINEHLSFFSKWYISRKDTCR